jgi:RND family efflux transporter MFP subunit
MIAFISLIYGSFYFLIFGKGIVKKSARNMSIFVGVGVVLVGAVVFVWLTVAPTTKDGRVFQYVIPIVPNVAGQVIEVPVESVVTINEGDVLFKIDPFPYQAAVDRLAASIDQANAQKRLAQIEVDRNIGLVQRSAAAQRDLDRWRAELDGANAAIRSLEAQLSNAQWELEQTVVRAPHEGTVVNLQLRPGSAARSFAATPAMSFISNEGKEVVASFSQSSIRRIQPGDPAEMVFALFPGEVFAGTITHVVKATGTAQLVVSGNIPVLTGDPSAGRYAVRIRLDDPEVLDRLPQGAGCSVVAYTSIGKPFHVISKVAMRMTAWMAYLTSPI